MPYPCAGYIECDAPNEDLYKFDGSLTLEQESHTTQVALDTNQVLLRVQPPSREMHITIHPALCPLQQTHLLPQGSVLRNTDWIIGVVLYTGHQTKYMLSTTYVPTPPLGSFVTKGPCETHPMLVYAATLLRSRAEWRSS
jgi:hypothetical protein